MFFGCESFEGNQRKFFEIIFHFILFIIIGSYKRKMYKKDDVNNKEKQKLVKIQLKTNWMTKKNIWSINYRKTKTIYKFIIPFLFSKKN